MVEQQRGEDRREERKRERYKERERRACDEHLKNTHNGSLGFYRQKYLKISFLRKSRMSNAFLPSIRLDDDVVVDRRHHLIVPRKQKEPPALPSRYAAQQQHRRVKVHVIDKTRDSSAFALLSTSNCQTIRDFLDAKIKHRFVPSDALVRMKIDKYVLCLEDEIELIREDDVVRVEVLDEEVLYCDEEDHEEEEERGDFRNATKPGKRKHALSSDDDDDETKNIDNFSDEEEEEEDDDEVNNSDEEKKKVVSLLRMTKINGKNWTTQKPTNATVTNTTTNTPKTKRRKQTTPMKTNTASPWKTHSSGKNRIRMHRFMRMKSDEKCGHCKMCLNPTAKKACLTRRAEMEPITYPADDTVCEECKLGDNAEQLMLCDGCDDGYHSYCVKLKEVPKGDWFCSKCLAKQQVEQEGEKPALRGAIQTENEKEEEKQQVDMSACPGLDGHKRCGRTPAYWGSKLCSRCIRTKEESNIRIRKHTLRHSSEARSLFDRVVVVPKVSNPTPKDFVQCRAITVTGDRCKNSALTCPRHKHQITKARALKPEDAHPVQEEEEEEEEREVEREEENERESPEMEKPQEQEELKKKEDDDEDEQEDEEFFCTGKDSPGPPNVKDDVYRAMLDDALKLCEACNYARLRDIFLRDLPNGCIGYGQKLGLCAMAKSSRETGLCIVCTSCKERKFSRGHGEYENACTEPVLIGKENLCSRCYQRKRKDEIEIEPEKKRRFTLPPFFF